MNIAETVDSAMEKNACGVQKKPPDKPTKVGTKDLSRSAQQSDCALRSNRHLRYAIKCTFRVRREKGRYYLCTTF